MNPLTLEITIKSAEVFKKYVLCVGKMQLYATAHLVGGDRNSAECRTHVDEYRGSRPIWWILASFRTHESEVRNSNVVLVFEVKCKKNVGPDKCVGTTYVPIKQFFDQCVSQGFQYQDVALGISSKLGKPRGVLYLSYVFTAYNFLNFPRLYVPSAPPMFRALDLVQEDRD
ncbi:PREDICTED: protein SRC2 homolog [Ipomoea nil]|uniref:protein SRC2 homolog n=1 Tax=Ipomoea nil TaxID=35883 RepID=UPI000901C812|nr:PREDICTED: protein SRC2 homolog [Ipomoea nil]